MSLVSIRLREIKLLQLFKEQTTTGLTSNKQLTCIGDQNLCALYKPDSVFCYNNNFQNILGSSSWKCDAPLVPDVQFEKIDVQCDKVPDSPYDDLVVEGSCRLRYLKKN